MNTTTVDIQEVQQRLDELILLVQQGNNVIIAQGNTPLARLAPIELPTTPRIAGLNQGAMRLHDDFNDPLPDEFWTGEE